MERASVDTSREIEVDGHRYKVFHPQVEVAWEIGIELTKLIGESVASMARAAGDKNSIGEALTSAVHVLLGKVDPKTSMHLVRKILKNVEVQGQVGGDNKKLLLDEAGIRMHFHGRTGSMMNVMGSALAFTHADFFLAMQEGIAKMMEKMGTLMTE